MQIQTVDLLIIGAGPSGMSTALHLLELDPSWAGRMVIVEKAAHPRHKLCGGGITEYGLRILRNLRLPARPPIPHAVVEDARFVYKDRTIHVRGYPKFIVCYRQEFDHYLAQTARARGIRLLENEPVTRLQAGPDGVRVETKNHTFLARIVVGADGSRGLTRKFVGGHTGPVRVARLLETVYPAPENAPTHRENYAIFDFTPAGKELQGYAWDFPARVKGSTHHNRGVYDARMASDRPKASLPALLEEALDEMGRPPRRLKIEGHPIHWFTPGNTFSSERVLLVGDAAGAEPLFGEGIAPALGYGQVAADAVQHAFKTNEFSFKRYKLRLLLSELGFYLTFRWYIAWWVYKFSGQAWYMHLAWTVCGLLAAITNPRKTRRA